MPYKDREQRLACRRRSNARNAEQRRAYMRAYKARPEVAMHDAFLDAPLTPKRVRNLEQKFGVTLSPKFVEMLQTLREYRRFKNPWPTVECACGCGGHLTGRNEYGERRRFIIGHWRVDYGSLPPRKPRGPDRRPRKRAEQMTPEARVERARKANAARRAKYVPPTHCRRGHEFTRGNTYLSTRRDGTVGRHCRTCALERKARVSESLTNGERE